MQSAATPASSALAGDKVATLASEVTSGEVHLTPDGTHVMFLYLAAAASSGTTAGGGGQWRINIDGTDFGPYDDIIPSYAYEDLSGRPKGFAGVDVSVPWFIYRVADKWTLRILLPRPENTTAAAIPPQEYALSSPYALRQLTCDPVRGKCELVTARAVTVFRPHVTGESGVQIGTPAWAAVLSGIVGAIPKWTAEDERFSLSGAFAAGEFDAVDAVVLSPDWAHHVVAYWQGHNAYVKVDEVVYEALGFTRAADGQGVGFFYKQDRKFYVYLNGTTRGPFTADAEDVAISSDLKHYAFAYKKRGQMYVRVDDQEFGGYDQIVNPPTFSDDARHYWFGHYRYDDFPRAAINIDGQDRGYSEDHFVAPFFSGDGQWRFVMKNAEGYFANTNGRLEKLAPSVDAPETTVETVSSPDRSRVACWFVRQGRWFVWADGKTLGGYESVQSVQYPPAGAMLSFVWGEGSGSKYYVHIGGRDYDVGAYTPQVNYSTDGKRFWFTYGRSINIDGTAYPWSELAPVHFSTDSARFAYVFRTTDGTLHVNASGTLSPGYEDVAKLTLSPDGSKLGFLFRRAVTGGRLYAYINGREHGPFTAVGYVFNERGEAVIAYAKDGALYRAVIP